MIAEDAHRRPASSSRDAASPALPVPRGPFRSRVRPCPPHGPSGGGGGPTPLAPAPPRARPGLPRPAAPARPYARSSSRPTVSGAARERRRRALRVPVRVARPIRRAAPGPEQPLLGITPGGPWAASPARRVAPWPMARPSRGSLGRLLRSGRARHRGSPCTKAARPGAPWHGTPGAAGRALR